MKLQLEIRRKQPAETDKRPRQSAARNGSTKRNQRPGCGRNGRRRWGGATGPPSTGGRAHESKRKGKDTGTSAAAEQDGGDGHGDGHEEGDTDDGQDAPVVEDQQPPLGFGLLGHFLPIVAQLETWTQMKR